MSQNILLISETILKERTAAHGNIDPKLIYPDIKYTQDVYIHPIIGSALYFKLQSIISDNTIKTNPVNAEYKKLIDDYIIDVIIYYTLSEIVFTVSYQIWNRGVLRKTGDNAEAPSRGDLVDISNQFKHRGEYYAKRLTYFLIEDAGSKFPEYLNPGSKADTIIPTMNQFTMPVYLDDDGCNKYCNKGGFNGQPYKE